MCQSCGMPLQKEEEFGTNVDGSQNQEYCIYCFKDGGYVQDMTFEEAIALAGEYADMAWVTKEEAIAYSRELFPTLKRWKQ